MAINRTGAIFKSFTFDGVDSRDFGVYITGAAVFNAPTRDVNMVTIPGRNGTFSQDNGRFENITITYPAGIYGATEADFAAGMEALRDVLCSRIGYKRLEDDYNASEYRMAVYKSGLEVTPEALRAGTFDIVFECKPQRWLKSGETESTMTSPQTLTNPTPYPAAPTFIMKGYGKIQVGSADSTIQITNNPYGLMPIWDAETIALGTKSFTYSDVTAIANTSDVMTLAPTVFNYSTNIGGIGVDTSDFALAISNVSGDASVVGTTQGSLATITVAFPAETFALGTAKTVTATFTATFSCNGVSSAKNQTVTIAYNGTSTFTFSATGWSGMTNLGGGAKLGPSVINCQVGQLNIDSTKTVNEKIIIDCENGLAYYEGGASANNLVTFPVELPTLGAGNTSISFPSGSFSYRGVKPNWWRV